MLVPVAVFLAMLVLVVLRPRDSSEAVWTVAAAGLLLLLGSVTLGEALGAVRSGESALVFLLALLLLSVLLGKSGFFDWAALLCARAAGGDGRVLYLNVFLLGAFVTAVLSLDTTAVLLTPILLALTRRLALPVVPFLFSCAFVANVGSLLLPISNLTNILFADALGLSFGEFVAWMALPQLVALAVTYGLLFVVFRRELPARFDVAHLPRPSEVVPHAGYFSACLAVLGVVLVGYFVGPLVGFSPAAVAFAGSLVLVVVGGLSGRVGFSVVREISWGVFPFVMGLFVVVRALEKTGVVAWGVAFLEGLAQGPERLFAAAGVTGLATNLMNNLPAALVAREVLVLSQADRGTLFAVLAGANIGPLVLPFGSLATLLVISIARKSGAELGLRSFVARGAWMTPLILFCTTAVIAWLAR